ncbi:DUF1376 domain-containing protein [Psychrobacter sp. 2Y5]|uniref:DUF1376 domain-containing protein n=1 Tax=unclassified Psychrobacter TaxID=196806 RepID=UPI003F45E64F
MHFVNHNFTDHDFETKHFNRIEKTIYLDLRSLYLSEEKPIDGSDMELLQRRLSVISDDEKQALAFVLKDKFKKAGKYYKRAAWDKILKDYKWGNKNKGNASGNAARNGVTFDVTQGVTPSNAGCNVTCNDNDEPMTSTERVRKSRQERKLMIDSLNGVGVAVDKGIKIGELRSLYVQHSDSISSKAVNDASEIVTQGVTPSNDDCNASNAKNAAITKNYEPITNNHKPISEDARTHEENSVVDSSVDNPTDDNQAAVTQTKADQIRGLNAVDIECWQAPTIDEMRGELFKAGKMMQLTDDQYDLHVSDFKSHYAEQALLGKPLVTESNRKAKLRKWLAGEVDKQAATQARQDKAKGRFNIDNADWSNSAGTSSNRHDSDLPPVFHPSHSQPVQPKCDPNKSCVFNGMLKEPLPSMTINDTYEYVKQGKMPGESSDEAYDRLLNELQEAV